MKDIERAIEFLESKKKKYDRNDPCVGCSRDFGCGSCHYVSTYLGNREHREKYKYNSTYEEYVANEYNLNYNLAILALQEKLDRQENKPLTVEELKEMIGKELYFVDKYDNPNQPNWSGWVTLEELNDTELCIGRKDFNNFTLRIYYDLIRNDKEIFFYKHKPKGEIE